jgi:hypothetical protein
MLAACQAAGTATPGIPATISPTPAIVNAAATNTISPAPAPTQYLEFTDLNELQKAGKFPIWLPAYIPDNLPFFKGWVTDYANGDQNVRLLYSEPGNLPDANLKSLDLQMTQTDESVSRDSLTHQFKIIAMDLQEVQVRGQPGFTYWVQSGAAGNFACLAWRAGKLNFLLTLSGDWPQPDGSNPHGLDATLVKVAESLGNVVPGH